MTTIQASTVLPVAQSIFQFYVSVMEQQYQSIRKGCGFLYACANMLYRRVKTEGNIKYLKCQVIIRRHLPHISRRSTAAVLRRSGRQYV